MKTWIITLLLLAIPFASLPSLAADALTPWQRVKGPVKATPHSVGEINNGCLIGGQALPLLNSSYQVLREDKLRYFGHPNLINFIQRITTKTQNEKLGIVLVGDMAMPAGGRFTTGHRSHQNGLDVDIWLRLINTRWTNEQLKQPVAIDLVNNNGKQVIEKRWSANIARLIKLSAQDSSVARIFVHPAIKLKLCETAGNDRQWLRKIRPWFGHRSHMHVRLNCPSDSKECIAQTAPPIGDGCGSELMSWFKDKQPLPTVKSKENELPPLPTTCQQLVDNLFKV